MSSHHTGSDQPLPRGHRGRFWQHPKLRDAENDGERRVGWLELFYDLVFVVVIAQLAHHLAEHLDGKGLLQFAATFVPVWWVWIGGMYYTERFETQDFSFRLFTFLQMLPVAGMALTGAYAFDGRWAGFAASYVFARCIIIFLWWRGARHNPAFRPTAMRFNFGFVISVLLWTSSMFTPFSISLPLAMLGLVCDLVAPWTTVRQQSLLPKLSASHLPERFGLFVIIVLGEAIIGVVNGVADSKSFELPVLLEGALGMLLVFSMWWLYFDFVARRSPRNEIRFTLPWSYLHLPLLMAITASSAASLNAIAAEGSINDEARWLMAGAVALKLTIVGLLEYTLERHPSEPTHEHGSSLLKFAAAFLALLVGAFSAGVSAVAFMLLLFAVMLIPLVYGLWVWFNRYPDAPSQSGFEIGETES
jgi:low temperature requirement protein LtrA